MMEEFFCDVDEAKYINVDRLGRTLKFVPTRRNARCSVGELLNSIAATGVDPEDISGIYKVSQNDFTFSVMFKFADSFEAEKK